MLLPLRWVPQNGAVRVLNGRIALFPFGAPSSSASRHLCAAQVERCGGTVLPSFARDPGSLNRFIEQTSRIPAISESAPSMVVMTEVTPLMFAVVVSRRRIENAISQLKDALWVLFVDSDQESSFLEEAQYTGELSGSLASAPLWIGPGDKPFLVLSAHVADDVDLQRRAIHCHGHRDRRFGASRFA
ncbi:MAG: hypothetical protein HY898_24675 [Deltaproteobacteria bacterium]|nr:hypothetical protein [Deltaproteobacteria bacterium]